MQPFAPFAGKKTTAERYIESADIRQEQTSIGLVSIGDEPRRYEHYEGVLDEVIEQDCYGVRPLKQKGFTPKTIVDVGMHVGTFSLLCHHLWPEARIVGVEMMRDDYLCGQFARAIARSLDANIAQSSNISVVRKALTGFYGNPEADVVYAQDFGKQHSDTEDRIRFGTHYWADGISVEDFLRDNAIETIDIMKIDVESSEVNIFRELAALNRLQDINIIRGEWHFALARKELERLLSPTHHLHMCWAGPQEEWNTFYAIRR